MFTKTLDAINIETKSKNWKILEINPKMDNILTVTIIKPDTCLSREKVIFLFENYINTKKV